MTGQRIQSVLNASDARGLSRLALIAMVLHCQNQRGIVPISTATLRATCNSSKNSVIRCVQYLEDSGEISHVGSTPDRTKIYRINIGDWSR